jgi:hypothetical protein
MKKGFSNSAFACIADIICDIDMSAVVKADISHCESLV